MGLLEDTKGTDSLPNCVKYVLLYTDSKSILLKSHLLYIYVSKNRFMTYGSAIDNIKFTFLLYSVYNFD